MSFIHEDFLLQSAAARRLYHGYAEAEPILDFHSHLPAAEIAGDRRFRDLHEIWLEGDHYKWRAMRANGVGGTVLHGRCVGVREISGVGADGAGDDWQSALSLDAFGVEAVFRN